MPQMFPMNWLYLPLTFSLLFILMFSVLFFLPSNPAPAILSAPTTMKTSWKW